MRFRAVRHQYVLPGMDYSGIFGAQKSLSLTRHRSEKHVPASIYAAAAPAAAAASTVPAFTTISKYKDRVD